MSPRKRTVPDGQSGTRGAGQTPRGCERGETCEPRHRKSVRKPKNKRGRAQRGVREGAKRPNRPPAGRARYHTAERSESDQRERAGKRGTGEQ